MPGESKKKGDVLEDVVAALHNVPGVRVETRVHLPSVRPNSSRKREIDVLLSSDVAGYPVRVAIECKNEKSPVDTQRIDKFLSALDDVGIPRTHGIFVTPTGYTKDALALASESGIRPLLLEGLTSDRLSHEVNEAVQSVVYLVATWRQLSRFDCLPEHAASGGMFIRSDLPPAVGQGTEGILTHLWQMWVGGKIPDELGEHSIFIRLPPEFTFSTNESPLVNAIVIADVEVVAHAVSIPGKAKRFVLKHAATSNIEKVRVEAEFHPPENALELVRVEAEKDLAEFLSARSGMSTLIRIRVPRLVSKNTFWPPTREAVRRVIELRQAGEEVTFSMVEGRNLARAWEYFIEDNST